MQNFTELIKNELTRLPSKTRDEALSLLSAFIMTSGYIANKNGFYGFELITENERTADYIFEICESHCNVNLSVSGAKFDVLSGKDKFKFENFSLESQNLLLELGILVEVDGGFKSVFSIPERQIKTKTNELSFIKGAFLGGGSCTIPLEENYSRTGYHFEIVFPTKAIGSDFCEILCDFEILAKLVWRKDTCVVYVKSKEVISDILNVLGAFESLEILSRLVEIKDNNNNANRINNCSVSNIDRTVTASVKLVRAIENISQTIGLQSLDRNLFEVAECRLADTNASMTELAQRLGISKSCINHRIRKIIELSKSLEQD